MGSGAGTFHLKERIAKPWATGWRYEWVQTTVLAPPRDSYSHSPRALARLPRRYQAPAYPHWRALAGTHRRIYAMADRNTAPHRHRPGSGKARNTVICGSIKAI